MDKATLHASREDYLEAILVLQKQKGNCIRKNPFNFAIADVLEDDTEEKAALTQEQEDRLLAFAGSDPVYRKYCDEIIILLGTGLRVSELCGLTTNLDFENRCIHVDHQLLRDSELGY